MIIFGYPGVGKSTIAKDDYRFIDLDSSDALIRWRWRRRNWEMDYCNMALLLSKQGYYVMVSTHPEVIKRLMSKEKNYCLCYPDIALREQWVRRLESRYRECPNRSTHNAWLRAKDHLEDDFYQMEQLCGRRIVIHSMDYNLKKGILNAFEGGLTASV